MFLNICYHNEHHDFPNIPWSRLPLLTQKAPEFYLNLKYYTSYTQVLFEFFLNRGIPFDELFDVPIDTPFGKFFPKYKKDH